MKTTIALALVAFGLLGASTAQGEPSWKRTKTPTRTATRVNTATVTPISTATPTATVTPLEMPSGIAVSANADGTVTVSWTLVPGADLYEIERADSATGPYVVVGVVAGGDWWVDPVSNVLPETTYWYRVRAFPGEVVDSNVATATTDGVAPLTLAGGLGALGLAAGAGFWLIRKRRAS